MNLRLDTWRADELARYDAERGRVDPAWRKVARYAEDAFIPDPRIVSQIDSATLWTRQVAKFLGRNGIASSQQLQHRVDPGIADAMRLEAATEDTPATWEHVEVEVETDESGEVRRTAIVESSDKSSLDDAAVDAIARALRSTPLPPKRARVRLAVEAGIVVQPPTVAMSANDHRPRPVPMMKFRFDEVSGKVEPRPWFLRRLVKRVSVLSSSSE